MKIISLSLALIFGIAFSIAAQEAKRPNVIYIYADDLGYGDLSCYGAQAISTPNLDKLAKQGIRFTNGNSTSATCTPSRYGLITGKYPWRKQGTGVLPGDAALIIPTNSTTLPKLFKMAGYSTGIIGKWHLGLGNEVAKDWNASIKPGPNEVGFDYSFIFPATADRVPTVFVENHEVWAQDPADPISVSYKTKVGNEPTGKENPELLKMKASPGQGHDQTIINGIGRIGYMAGGKRARWVDEEVSTTFLTKAKTFIDNHKNKPFFLYFCLTEPHVPRMPATMFKGKSKLGYRGDAILQLDWTVGEIMKQLEWSGQAKNTIIIFTSDNGPVLDDGYQDDAVTKLNGHSPTGALRGGKYSALEGGTRVPFIVSWPGTIKSGVSAAMVSQLDMIASFANFLGVKIPAGEASDSENTMNAFLGKSNKGRSILVKQAASLSLVKEGWKYISPNKGQAYYKLVGIESGNSTEPQLFNLTNDPAEKNNLAGQYPEKVKELAALLDQIKEK